MNEISERAVKVIQAWGGDVMGVPDERLSEAGLAVRILSQECARLALQLAEAKKVIDFLKTRIPKDGK